MIIELNRYGLKADREYYTLDQVVDDIGEPLLELLDLVENMDDDEQDALFTTYPGIIDLFVIGHRDKT